MASLAPLDGQQELSLALAVLPAPWGGDAELPGLLLSPPPPVKRFLQDPRLSPALGAGWCRGAGPPRLRAGMQGGGWCADTANPL